LLALAPVATFVAQIPETPKRIIKENYFGKEIEDPYRWLENVKDPEVLKWLADQNSYTRSVIDAIPERSKILERMRQLDAETPPPLSGFSRDESGRYYFYRSGPSGISKGYVRDPQTGRERILIDPQALAAPGQSPPRVSAISPSPDGRYIAFLIRGIGRTKAQIMEIATGALVGKPVENLLGFSNLDWDPDSKSIYVVKMPPIRPDMKPSDAFLNGASYRHVVGTDQASDQPILLQSENRGLTLKATSWPFVFPTPDGRFLAVWIEDGARTGHALYVAPRSEIIAGKGTWRKIAEFEDGATGIVFHDSEAFLTTAGGDGASRVIRVLVDKQDISTGRRVELPERMSAVSDVQAASDALYVAAREGSVGVLYRVSYDGTVNTIKLPLDGSVRIVSVIPSLPGGLFRIAAWTRPSVTYLFDAKKGWAESDVQPASDQGKLLDLQAESVSVTSHDGVQVPLTIISRRGLKRDSSNPAYMIGYGSYAAVADPGFDNVFVPWFEAGGILAFAHVRGGGELGEAWHQAGSKDKKPNTWLDFIACARYLIDRKYTASARLAGGGVSAGGILIGRAITERPELFGAALISVATTDMLRAEYQMNGPANVVEFGTTKDKTGFEQLYEMSAYHHVKDGVRYPAVLLSTGMKDTNVDVWQPAKMTANLQSLAASNKPVLLRVDPDAGHDQYGSTRKQVQELRADQLTFLLWQLGIVGPHRTK
jgi:prolyl oligopeptidase